MLRAFEGTHTRQAELVLARWLLSPQPGRPDDMEHVSEESVRQLGATLEYVRLRRLVPPSATLEQVFAQARALAGATLARNSGATELKERWGLTHWAYPPSRLQARLRELQRS